MAHEFDRNRRNTLLNECCDCRDGEHEDYDDNVVLVIVSDPETGRIVKKAKLCEEHRITYTDDGYRVTE